MKMKKQGVMLLSLLSAAALLLCACGEKGGEIPEYGGSEAESECSEPISAEPTPPLSVDPSFSVGVPEDLETTFRMETEDGAFTREENVFTVTAAGTYDCFGDLNEGRIVVAAPKDAKVVLTLNGCTIVNRTECPIHIRTASEADISAKKDTENFVYDLREITSEEDAVGGAIYAECDLTLKGYGKLEAVSNYNNGIHSKDDLKLKNLSLTVKAVNNALKGNDGVSVSSGVITAISSGGDAVKTTSTDLSKKGNQKGCVRIDGGEVSLYAACDGIDAAADVTVSGDAVLNIYTDSYSPYSADVMQGNGSTVYLRLDGATYNAGYKYSAYFYNPDGSYVWKDLTFYKQVAASTAPGGMPGGMGGRPGRPGAPGGMPGVPGGMGTNYYYYAVTKPTGYTSVKFYAYTSAQEQGQKDSYAAVSNANTTLPDARDTFAVSSVSGGVIASSGWTNYQTAMGNTGLAYSCKGIKAGNTVCIEGGTVTVKSKDDGLHADFNEVLESTGKKGSGNILITGGVLTVTSDDDGIHADQDLTVSGGEVRVLTSYEGLEANRIHISDGVVQITSRDDGINANSKGAYAACIEISGGTVDVTVPSGDTDTVDSNGTVRISGGFVFLKNGQTNGSSMTGGTIDTDRGVTVTGGTVISVGCIGDKISGSSYNTSLTLSSGAYELKNASGDVIAAFSLTSSYRAYMFWSDVMVSGQTYLLTKDGTEIARFTK